MDYPDTRPVWPEASPLKKFWHLRDDVVFLNHGSFGACPRMVLEFQTRLREEMEAEPVQFLARNYQDRLDQTRHALADFVGADPANLAFVTNSTSGVNAVVRSLGLRSGDEILTTSLDYNACRNVLVEAAEGSGASLKVAEVPFPVKNGEEVVQSVLRMVSRNTRLVMIDHVTSNTGMILPVEQLVRELEGRGVETLVDGAHAPGMLPLDIESLGASYYTGNLHKWVCAPKGAAFLWVRPDRQGTVQPVTISHGNSKASDNPFLSRFDWPGTQDPSAWFSVPKAIRWMELVLPGGWPAFRSVCREKVLTARAMLCDRLEINAPCPESMVGTMATLPMPGKLALAGPLGRLDSVYQRLFDHFGIELHVVRLGNRRWFRVSAHLHNSADEYRYLADALSVMPH